MGVAQISARSFQAWPTHPYTGYVQNAYRRSSFTFRALSLAYLLASFGSIAHAQDAAVHPASEQNATSELKLPPGFTATVVADGIANARHIAVRDNGDLYISTRGAKQPGAIIALHLGPGHKVANMERFGKVTGGTGIRFYHNFLYVTSQDAVYRYKFDGDSLVPTADPEVIVSGMPAKGFSNRAIAFDDHGSLFVGVGSTGNICAEEGGKKGLEPCPALTGRSGIWRFDANRPDQKFPQDGEQIATGVRDLASLAWSSREHALYALPQGRNGVNAAFPDLVSADADENGIAEEMFRVTKGTNFGWPYTYYDYIHKQRVLAPEYGGDGIKPPSTGNYSTPVLAFPAHSSPMDLVFYNGKQFPSEYQGGAFVVMHGGVGPDVPNGHHGYQVLFVPMHKNGPASYTVFADDFAGDSPADRTPKRAQFRPVGAAVGNDGSLYIVDSSHGRLWRITYDRAKH